MGKEYVVQLLSDGDSQIVRLPEECRLDASAVRIRRQGRAIILEPLEKPSFPEGYFERLKALAADLPDDFRPQSS
jgi:antitoxin VapB